MKNNKLFIGLVAVIAIILIVVIFSRQKAVSPTIENPTSTPPVATSTPTTGTPKTNPALTAKLSYEDALKKYADYRIQFNQTCQAEPAQQTYKNGTTVMFDNRSTERRIITVDGKPYTFVANGYWTINLSSKTLPHTVVINCGAQKNVAQITLQK